LQPSSLQPKLPNRRLVPAIKKPELAPAFLRPPTRFLLAAGPDQLAFTTARAATDFQTLALELAGAAVDHRHNLFKPGLARCGVDQLEAASFGEQADFLDIENQRPPLPV
jgi:hypothetical protein